MTKETEYRADELTGKSGEEAKTMSAATREARQAYCYCCSAVVRGRDDDEQEAVKRE